VQGRLVSVATKFIFALTSNSGLASNSGRVFEQNYKIHYSNLMLTLQPKNNMRILVLLNFCLFLGRGKKKHSQFLPILIVACLLITSGDKAVSLATSWKKKKRNT
jgi:ribosomal protein L24